MAAPGRCRILTPSVLVWTFTWAAVWGLLVLPGGGLAQLSWDIDTVDAPVSASGATALALDANGGLHLAYVDGGRGTVVYARLDDAGWVLDPLDGLGSPLGGVDLALDAAGRPHLSYFDASSMRIGYAHFDGVDWRVLPVDESHREGYNSVAIASDGTVYVAYAGDTGRPSLAQRQGASWLLETVNPDVVTARFVSLDFDPEGDPHLAYYGNGVLFYSEWIGFRWAHTVVDDEESPSHVNLELAPSGDPVIGYRNNMDRSLRFAWWNGTEWMREVVDDEGDTGWDASMAVGAGGIPHMAYYERQEGVLKYVVRDQGGWNIYVVEREGVVGWWSSIAIDTNGLPHLSYYSWTDESIRLAAGTPEVGIRSLSPREVTPTSARLVAEVTSLGNAPEAVVRFELRETGGNWTVVGKTVVQDTGEVLLPVENLQPETAYEFRSSILVSGVAVHGEVVAFATPPVPRGIVLPEALVLGVSAAVLAGVAVLAWWARARGGHPTESRPPSQRGGKGRRKT